MRQGSFEGKTTYPRKIANGSLCGLKSSLKNLDQKQEEREAYDSAIKDQLESNIIKEVTDTEINNSSNEFCTTHRVVIR